MLKPRTPTASRRDETHECDVGTGPFTRKNFFGLHVYEDQVNPLSSMELFVVFDNGPTPSSKRAMLF